MCTAQCDSPQPMGAQLPQVVCTPSCFSGGVWGPHGGACFPPAVGESVTVLVDSEPTRTLEERARTAAPVHLPCLRMSSCLVYVVTLAPLLQLQVT